VRAEAQPVAGRTASRPSDLAFAFNEASKAIKTSRFEHSTITINIHANYFAFIFNNFIFVAAKIILKTSFGTEVFDQIYFAVQCSIYYGSSTKEAVSAPETILLSI